MNAATDIPPAARKTLHTIQLKIDLKTPFLVQGSHPNLFGLDAVQMKNAQTNTRILPGTLLAGRISEAWNQASKAPFLLTSLPTPEDWFARKKEDTGANQRARIMVDDLYCQSQGDPLHTPAVRIRIDPGTQAADHGALVLIEQNEAAYTSLRFEGAWRVWLEDETERAKLKQALLAGLLWHNQLGAFRSIGFGALEAADVSISPTTATTAILSQENPIKEVPARCRLALTLDRPFCVNARSRRGNVFVSDDILTGGTLKGALATMLNAYEPGWTKDNTLRTAFETLRISHAFPAIRQGSTVKRPVPLPLSLVSDNSKDENKVHDAALCTQPTLLKNADGNEIAPAFSTDWKLGPYLSEQSWGKTSTELRVRTAIDEKEHKAKDESLFAYECKVPQPDTCWLTDLDFSHCDTSQRAVLWNKLEALFQHGIGPIGKTDAWAHVELVSTVESVWESQHGEQISAKSVSSANSSDRAGFYVLQLVTPALLFPTSAVADQSHIDLKAIYSRAFAQLPGGHELKLSHFFARQSMAGGYFLWRNHIQKKSTAYRPYVLTDAGSVFVFTAAHSDRPEKAQASLNDWIQTGLPLPQDVQKEHGNTWKENPYIPENGFGEVVVNLSHPFPFLQANS